MRFASGFAVPLNVCPPVSPSHCVAATKTVVVIDDGEDLVESVVMLLQLEGYRAFGTGDGAEGIALVLKERADVVVLDFLMPRMNGGEVGRRLRAEPAARDVKIVLCSGTPEHMVRVAFTGYDTYLAKPVFPEAFLRTIENLLPPPACLVLRYGPPRRARNRPTTPLGK